MKQQLVILALLCTKLSLFAHLFFFLAKDALIDTLPPQLQNSRRRLAGEHVAAKENNHTEKKVPQFHRFARMCRLAYTFCPLYFSRQQTAKGNTIWLQNCCETR